MGPGIFQSGSAESPGQPTNPRDAPALDEGLPRAYTPELFEKKVAVLFEHVYDSYQREGRSVYTRVA